MYVFQQYICSCGLSADSLSPKYLEKNPDNIYLQDLIFLN